MKHINPTTEEVSEIEEFPLEKIPDLIKDVLLNSNSWSNLSVAERTRCLENLPEIIKNEEETIIKLFAEEMGKPLFAGRIEISRTIEEMCFTLKNAVEWLSPEILPTGEVNFTPLGVTAVISPWNFPFMLPLRSIIPALLAGNSIIFKPSELSPKCGKLLTELLYRSSPILKNHFKLITGGKDHGKVLIQQNINAIAFTGSTEVGKKIASDAGNSLKRISLELGGLDPAIVFNDVDVEQVCKAIIHANIFNSGQVCNAVKRALVEESIYEKFVEKITDISRKITCKEPDQDGDMGPLASKAQLERVESFIQDAISKGAKIISGGARHKKSGYFFPSTVVVNVNNSMKLLKDEAFGPILPIQSFKNVEEAIAIANETRYGLSASIWTENINSAKYIAQRLDFGTVSINSHKAGGPGTPWGGNKESGIGRMKTKEGLREFTNVKFIKY